MSGEALNPAACAAFLVTAFTLAGIGQTAWLALPASRRFAIPLDAGGTFRGRRLFGANKTLRGFVIMVPATGLSFAILAGLLGGLPYGLAGLWPISPGDYALLGMWAGFGFMFGELPNSFVKRQLGVAPGHAATTGCMHLIFVIFDRIDSILGMLLALTIAVPVPWLTCAYVLIAGSLLHASFSLVLFQLGGKLRAA
jgi:CDP-2,3-bis-(O-geranylgeranyl)-sn-glycerol synthase